MAFLFWILFIVSFLMTVSVIISVLRKKYYGWESFFTILRNVNILSVCIAFVYIFYFSWNLPRGPFEGSWIQNFYILPYIFLPLLIIDLILILLYFFTRHRDSKTKIIPYWVLIALILAILILDVFRPF